MEIIRPLGDLLAIKININPPAARGLLKLAIKDELGPFRGVHQITFNDYKQVIQKALVSRLKILGVPDYNKIAQLLVEKLVDNQSIISISEV